MIPRCFQIHMSIAGFFRRTPQQALIHQRFNGIANSLPGYAYSSANSFSEGSAVQGANSPVSIL